MTIQDVCQPCEIIVCFTRSGTAAHALHIDARTALGPWVKFFSAETLDRAMVLSRLMRHAQVSITMNVYGSAYMEGKREARSKVVQMVLPRANEKAATAMAASYLSCPRQSDCGLGIR
jgi:hypothetical protein